MPSYASFAAAREAEGAITRLLLRIDLSDPDSIGATNLSLLGDTGDIIVLGGVDDGLWKWGSGATNYVEPAVTDWGTIGVSGDVGTAFASLGDVQLALRNTKLSGQLPNSAYTFASGSPAMSPVPDGDEITLAEVFQHRAWHNAPLTITLYIYSRHVTTASADREEKVLFSGSMNGLSVDGDTVYIDATQSTEIQDASLPGRVIDNPPELAARGSRAPIAYGTGFLTTTERRSMTTADAVAAGLILPVVPAVAYAKNATSVDYIYNDCAGPNSGWTNQTYWGSGDGKSDADDHAYIIDPESTTYAVLIEAGSTPGSEFVDTSTTNAELLVRAYGQARARAYVRAIEVSASTGLTNATNSVDDNFYTSATLSLLSTSNYANWLVNTISPMGQVPGDTDDVVVGYFVISANVAGGSPQVGFGIYVPSVPQWFQTSSQEDTSSTFSVGLYYQDTIPKTQYFSDTGSGAPLNIGLKDWNWEFYDSPSTPTSVDPTVMRLEVNTAGTGSASIDVVAAGYRVEFIFVRGIRRTADKRRAK